ncbi:MAG: 3-isopropylmalate dehydrogenase [Chloroflexota bacterium]
MNFNIAVLDGDGIGTEVCAETIKVLNALGKRYGHTFSFEHGLVGGIAIDATGGTSALPQKSIDICKASDAVLFGATGGPKWDNPLAKVRPEDGILGIRKALGLFANIRPVKLYPELIDATNLKPDVVRGTDFIFIRELTGGLYFGKPKKTWTNSRGRQAVDSERYSEKEITRVLRVGFELAKGRRKKLTSVDKANVMETSRLWRQIAIEMSKEYPEVTLEHQLVDSCAMRLIQRPTSFDVAVTSNIFGDILTDEASVVTGSMGMMPSASLAGTPVEGKKAFGLYEPIHGSAPDIAGQNKANPIATILSGAFMLRYSLGLLKEAAVIENAVSQVIKEGYRTGDIMSPGMKLVGCKEMGTLLAERV